MASTYFDLEDDWSATNRYTAAADVDILVSNSGGYAVRWSITSNDTAPTIPVSRAHVLGIGDRLPLQLSSGERLWLAGTNADATLEV